MEEYASLVSDLPSLFRPFTSSLKYRGTKYSPASRDVTVHHNCSVS